MGWQTQVAVQLQAGDTIINPSGNFVYSGTPALGNLIVSVAPAAGTDQFGNTYLQGVTAYTTIAGNIFALQMGTSAGFPAFFVTNLTSAPAEPPAFTASASSPTGCIAQIQSGMSTAGSAEAAIQVSDSTASGVSGGEVGIIAGKTILNSSASSPIPVPNVSLLISSLPNDTNSGSTWVTGERAFMNNNWVALINQNTNAIISALQQAGIIT